jgi:hypothetical protein
VNHYEVLGVPVDATAAEVRAAFVAQARRHHPDFFAGAPAAARADAEQRMRAINEAWVVLSDAGRRARYDRELGLVPDPEEEARRFRPSEPDAPDAPDPRDEPDTPYRRRSVREERRARLATLVPVELFAVSVALFIAWLLLSVPVLGVLGGVAFLMSCVGFIAIPLVRLAQAARDEG